LRQPHTEPDQRIIKLDPSTGVRQVLNAQRSDAATPSTIKLDMELVAEGGKGPTPCEVPLVAALKGKHARLVGQDGREETWRVMALLIDQPRPSTPTSQAAWGPDAADALTAGRGPDRDH
jgi:glucose-6-phosphate 1-dehydrogenase